MSTICECGHAALLHALVNRAAIACMACDCGRYAAFNGLRLAHPATYSDKE